MSALREYSLELGERVTRMGVGWCWRIRRGPGARIRWIAGEVGVRREAVRTWVRWARDRTGAPGPGPPDGVVQRIQEPALEVRRLRRANAILRSACLSIAAECERPSR